MTRKAQTTSDTLRRIPGLYRRWELPEILGTQRAYRIENAGAHQDGTPLVAVYGETGVDHRAALPPATSAPPRVSVPPGTISRRPE